MIEAVESAEHLAEMSGVKKLKGFDGFYPIKIDDLRLGIVVEANVIEFVRCLDRKDIYRNFP